MPPELSGVLRWLLPVAAVAVLAVGGLAVLWWFLEPIASYLGVADDERLDIVRVYLLAVGGGLLIWQVSIANRRASSAERVAELTELGNITERFNAAIANLGSDNSVVRIGALHQLHHIARDAANYRSTAHELLIAHLAGISDSILDPIQLSEQSSVEYETVFRMLREFYESQGVFYEEEENAEDGG